MVPPSGALAAHVGATDSSETGVALHALGLQNPGPVHANLAPAALTEAALNRHEGLLSKKGAFVAYTGVHTGRSPKDRFLVSQPGIKEEIWWGPVNHPIEPDAFERLRRKVLDYLEGRDLFVNDGWACADPALRLRVRVISDLAWHALFANCLFLRPTAAERAGFQPDLTVIHASGLQADPKTDGTRSDVFIFLSLEKRLVLIGGTHYAGEIKKSVFSVLNYLMPQ
jgi:phosphoenolpyruvate carboxykinase (ATP)